jgi:hypothetical protein
MFAPKSVDLLEAGAIARKSMADKMDDAIKFSELTPAMRDITRGVITQLDEAIWKLNKMQDTFEAMGFGKLAQDCREANSRIRDGRGPLTQQLSLTDR